MAWSVKLQSGTGGTQGYNEWQAVYDAASQTALKLKYGFSLGNQAPDVLFHTPDNGAPIPVRANGANRLLFLTVDIPASATWDSITGLVNTLARLVDGPNSQAVRAQTAGDVDKVRVAIKPNGATYTTYFEVLTGFMDTSTAFTEPDAVLNVLGRNVTLALTCKPYGYGDSFTLSNRLASSPHMIEDSNADGLADGLTKLSTPTCTIDTTYYLIGGKSQKIVTDAVNEGIIAAYSASGSIGDTATIKGYVNINTAAKTVTCQLRNGGATTIATVSVPSGATRTITGPDGDDWYEFNLSGTATTTSGWQIYVYAPDASVTFYVDGLYLATGTLTSVPGWSSKRNLYNRMDPAIATTNIPYLDIWGLPGDAPAQVDILAEPSAGKATQFIIGSYADGIDLATAVDFYHDSSEFATPSGTWTTGTGTINNDYKQCSTTTGALIVAGSSEIQKISNLYTRQPWRVFVRAYTSDTAATIQMKYYSANSVSGGGVLVTQTAVGQLTETSKWQLVDLGTLNLLDVLSNDVLFALSEEIHITQASSQTLRIDGVYYMPTATGFNISKHYDLSGATKNFLYDAPTNQSYDNNTAIRLESLGDVPYLMPGNVMNRIVFIALDGTDNEHDITTIFPVTLTVTPRTSHLLGVS